MLNLLHPWIVLVCIKVEFLESNIVRKVERDILSEPEEREQILEDLLEQLGQVNFKSDVGKTSFLQSESTTLTTHETGGSWRQPTLKLVNRHSRK